MTDSRLDSWKRATTSAREPIGGVGVVAFFGCWSRERKGHCLYNKHGYTMDRFGPIDGWHLDGKYAPASPSEDETLFNLAHVNGFTVMAMWDRTADSRHKSNAAFVAAGTWPAGEMWALIDCEFPQISARLKAKREPVSSEDR